MDDAQEQNERDDGNVDDQGSDEEEEEAGEHIEGEGERVEDFRVFHVGYDNSDYYRRQFEIDCGRIEQNDPDFRSFNCPYNPIVLNDNRAVLLGKALLGNSNFDHLQVGFAGRADFSSQGAKAFVRGVLSSQIKNIYLVGNGQLPMEISQLCAKSIENIHLHIPMGDEFAIHIGEHLAASNLLRRISIRVDQMTPRGAQGLSKFLRTSSVTSLDFIVPKGNFVTPSVMQTLYLEGVQHCQSIRDLYLENTVDDMHALATTLPKLHQLCIDSVNISLLEVELLAHGLNNANQLHTLTFLNCGLDHEHMSVLSPILGNHSSIERVILEDTEIGDAGITSFVEHWHPESKIEKLMLCSNDIGFKGAEILIKASSSHSALYSIDLSFNKFIGYTGLKMIGDALPGTKIQTLRVDGVVNRITYEDSDCDEAILQEAECMAACDALLEGVRRNLHLRKVRLEFLHLPTAVTEEIDMYSAANALGRCAVLEQSHVLPSGVWSHFFSKSRMSSSLLFFFLRELHGVVMGGTIGKKRRRL